MGKFTSVAPQRSVISTTVPSLTFEGGDGYLRDEKSELFLLGISNMVSENKFYESARDSDARFLELVRKVGSADFDWAEKFSAWLRSSAGMRSASIIVAAELARIAIDTNNGRTRSVVRAALRRPDEPAEFLAYWRANVKRSVPSGVKRGISDAMQSLYHQRSALKYDGVSNNWRMGDVVDIVHPQPKDDEQSILYRYLLDRRHHPESANPDGLPIIARRAQLNSIPKSGRREMLSSLVNEDGITWEWLSGWLPGGMDKDAWEAVIPHMGYFALMRNLRNFDEAGISDDAYEYVSKYLTDTNHTLFPLRFLAAYRTSSIRWHYPLESGLAKAVQNVPQLDGSSLILIDRSGSMFYSGISGRSSVSLADTAAVFGLSLATKCKSVTVVQYGSRSSEVSFHSGQSVLNVASTLKDLGGTDTWGAVKRHYGNHDRVIIITDEQYGYYSSPYNPGVPVYTWNLGGYMVGHPQVGKNSYTFGGLSDASFKVIDTIEKLNRQEWPF